MQLYKLLSTSGPQLVRSLFPLDVIKRALPYINGLYISNITHDPINDTCTAFVHGSKRYKVLLELNARGDRLVSRCTCPAAQSSTSPCKHAAAVVIVFVEHFSQLHYVKPAVQDFYKKMVERTFNEAPKHTDALVVQNTPAIPTFTKPTVVFVKNARSIYPYLVLTNGTERTKKIARLLEKSNQPEFDEVIEKIFEKPEYLDYAIYTKNGFVPLQLDKAQVVTPVWQMKQLGSTVEFRFICKGDGITLLDCIPLGAHYVIDLAQGKIIQLSVANRHCYNFFNQNILGLIFEIRFSDEDHKQSLGVASKLTYFMAANYQLNPLRYISIASAVVAECLAFPDKNFQTSRAHFEIVDRDNRLIALDIAPVERHVEGNNNVYIDNIHFQAIFSVAGENVIFHWPRGANIFAELLNTAFQNDAENVLPAMLAFAHSFYDQKIDAALRKERFFTQVGAKSISQQFFAKMDYFWTDVFQYDTVKLIYCEEKVAFSYYKFLRADLFIAILALIAFVTKEKQKFETRDAVSLATTLSKKMIGPLAAYLQQFGIVLYVNQKKVVERNIAVEVDMQSLDDWFSITPAFYEKDVLLTEEEWQQLLAATDSFRESATEFQVFDEKTEQVLAALRSIKSSYQSKEPSKDRSKETQFEIPRLHVFTLLSLNKAGVKVKASPEDKAILKSLHNFTQVPACELPTQLNCTMRDYQIKGYEWLAFLYKHKFGACLADEMGLGKTVQTIAFLAGIREGKIPSWDSERKRQHLIVAPASVVGNWEQELQRFYPDFVTQLYLGTKRTFDPDLVDIILTTYDTLRSDIETFKKTPFHVAIFDEAQAVKNHKSQRAEAVQQLQAFFKLSLTGTPLENNAQELCSIMNLTLPGLLPNDSAVVSLVKKGEYQALHERIAPFVLRRTKQEYLQDLPEKTEQNIYLKMTKQQKGFYGAIVDEIKQQVYKAYREKTQAQAGIVALTALLRLRQICAAPALIDGKQEKLSPKVEYLLAEIATYIKEQTPLLVFSQFIGMLDIVAGFLKKNKIPYLRIDGSVTAMQRKKIVADFQKSTKIFVLLLSLKTGGVGLNLTRARVVIHLDPWWNPAVENQASDRVHRIGQEHDVKILRLIMKDSIEEKMLVLKQKKKELFDAIMQGASGTRGTALTKQDFDFLLV